MKEYKHKLYVVTQTTKAVVWGRYAAEAERALERSVEARCARTDTTRISEEMLDVSQLPEGWSTEAEAYGEGPDGVTVGEYLKVPIALRIEIKPWHREQVEAFIEKLGGAVTSEK